MTRGPARRAEPRRLTRAPPSPRSASLPLRPPRPPHDSPAESRAVGSDPVHRRRRVPARDRCRSGRRDRPVDGPRRAQPIRDRAAARLPAQSARRASHTPRDPALDLRAARLRGRRLRRVRGDQPDPCAAGLAGQPVRDGPATAVAGGRRRSSGSSGRSTAVSRSHRSCASRSMPRSATLPERLGGLAAAVVVPVFGSVAGSRRARSSDTSSSRSGSSTSSRTGAS